MSRETEHPFDRLIADSTWRVIQAITKGESLEVAIHSNFTRTLNYLKEIGYIKEGKS